MLRERGHSPSEAFNETVEEATQSLYPLIGANGLDYMFAACMITVYITAQDSLSDVFRLDHSSPRRHRLEQALQGQP